MLGQIEILTKLAENGIIAAAFLYTLYWLLNKQSREAAEHSKQDKLTNLEVASSIRLLVNAVTAMQQQLLMHDLTMSGLSQEDDADSLAVKKYTDVMAALEEQREIIRKLNHDADIRMNQIRNS